MEDSLFEKQTGGIARRVALFLGYGWARVSTVPIMTARYLASRGFQVDMFLRFDPACDSLGVCRLELANPLIQLHYYLAHADDGQPEPLDGGVHIPRDYWGGVAAARKLAVRHDWAIGFDSGGLFCAASYAGTQGIPYVYHSLEIEEGAPYKGLERRCHAGAAYSLTQSGARADILASLNRVARRKIFVVPNSSMGDVIAQRNTFFRDMFPEIDGRAIALASGSLIRECCIEQLALSAESWPDDFVLVLHGWLPDPEYKKRIIAHAAGSDKVYLSQRILPPEEKFTIFTSVDYVLVFFDPAMGVNLEYAAPSSGKYYDALRCGIPMIGNDIPGMREMLNDRGCGITVDSFEGIAVALPILAKYHDSFRQRCFAEFPKHEFSKAYDSILKIMSRILAWDKSAYSPGS